MVHEWLEYPVPSVVFPSAAKRLGRSCAELFIEQGDIESSHQGLDISVAHRLSEAMTIYFIGKMVAFGDHRG